MKVKIFYRCIFKETNWLYANIPINQSSYLKSEVKFVKSSPPIIFIWSHSRCPVNSHLILLKVLSHIHTSWLKKCLNLHHNRFGDISNYCTDRNARTKLQEISYHGAVYGPWRLESIGWCEAKNQSLSHLVCCP